MNDSREEKKFLQYLFIWKMHTTESSSNQLVELLVQYGMTLTLILSYNSSTVGKNSHHVTWTLDLHTPEIHHGTSIRLFPDPGSLQCLQTGIGGSVQQGSNSGTYSCRWWAYLQSNQWHPHSIHCYLGRAGKSITLMSEDRVRNQCKVQAMWCIKQKGNASSLLQWGSQWVHEQNPPQHNVSVQDTSWVNETQVQ